MKRYISANGDQYTFYVKVGEKNMCVGLKGSGNDFKTNNERLQKAIEESTYFKTGKIVLDGGKTADESAPKIPSAPAKEYPEVTDIQSAIDILRAEPYKVHHTKLTTPEKVLAVASELGVSFPNLKVQASE